MLPQRALYITQRLKVFTVYGTRRSYLVLVGGLYRRAVPAVNIGEESRDEHYFYICSKHSHTDQARLCYFSEPDAWKALSFLWLQGTGVLDKTMVLLTIYIHLRLQLPTPTPILSPLIPISCHYVSLLYPLI